MKANNLVRKLEEHSDMALYFRPFDLSNSGVMVVTDSSLGNVKADGSTGDESLEKLYSQSSYIVLLARKR